MCEMTIPSGGGERDHAPHRLTALAVAEELVQLTAALSELAYDLGGDPATVRRHMSSLQSIDLITQIHLALAGLLRSEASVADRLAQVPVESLEERLRARMLDGGWIGEEAKNVNPDQDTIFL